MIIRLQMKKKKKKTKKKIKKRKGKKRRIPKKIYPDRALWDQSPLFSFEDASTRPQGRSKTIEITRFPAATQTGCCGRK